MPKAKISLDAEIDPALAYFEDYQNGMTIIDICRKYGKSRNTVVKYLKQNKDYQPPGYGYHITGDARKLTNLKGKETKLISFNCPIELLELLAFSPGKNKTERIHLAVKDYLEVPAKQRYVSRYKISADIPYKNTKVELETKLLKKLDRSKQDRSSKLIAAIEQYLVKNGLLK